MIIVVVFVLFWRRRKTVKKIEGNIWRGKINGDGDRATNRQGEYSAIGLRRVENRRQRFALHVLNPLKTCECMYNFVKDTCKRS